LAFGGGSNITPAAIATSTRATTTPTKAHGFRLAGSAAATLQLEDPAATAPLADVAKTVAAALDAVGVFPGIAVAPHGFPPLLTGIPELEVGLKPKKRCELISCAILHS
jgi:hypothetical protein